MEMIRSERIRCVFQPILDLETGETHGHELLARGVPPLESPGALFDAARRSGRSWELEYACRRRALRAIGEVLEAHPGVLFFLNVSPDIFSDPRFGEGFTLEALRRLGIDQHRIVLEITERASIDDPSRFERLVRHYGGQGFRLALDDFGAGHSGMLTLVRCVPHYMKLDMGIVRAIQESSYRQKLVRALVSFAASVEARLIAEGIETREELEVLLRLGVRYGQGFLFARPAPCPPEPDPAVVRELREAARRRARRASDLDEPILNLVVRSVTVQEGTCRCEDVDRLFRHNPGMDHLVLLRGESPVGLITRPDFYLRTGGPVGYHLFAKKPAETAGKRLFLAVDEEIQVIEVARRAMARASEDLYDPVLLVGAQGEYRGTLTIKRLIDRATELEIESAQCANPLTGLPGNRSIEKWIREALDRPEFAVVYADLDRFKEYNDRYGFLRGDEMLRVAGKVLAAFEEDVPGVRVGHVGGDDFVLVAPRLLEDPELDRLCAAFDREREPLFSAEDRERGGYAATDRQGNRVEVPLVTMSLAVIDSRHVDEERRHPAYLSQSAASVKKRAKRLSGERRGSAWAAERRFAP